jgi:hypothetical protein
MRIGAGVNETMAAQVLGSVAPMEESSRERGRGRRRSGGKKRKLPPLPYLYHGAVVVGVVVVLHYPDRFGRHRHVVARHGAAVSVTVQLG